MDVLELRLIELERSHSTLADFCDLLQFRRGGRVSRRRDNMVGGVRREDSSDSGAKNRVRLSALSVKMVPLYTKNSLKSKTSVCTLERTKEEEKVSRRRVERRASLVFRTYSEKIDCGRHRRERSEWCKSERGWFG